MWETILRHASNFFNDASDLDDELENWGGIFLFFSCKTNLFSILSFSFNVFFYSEPHISNQQSLKNDYVKFDIFDILKSAK
jgi:hypothetical protein